MLWWTWSWSWRAVWRLDANLEKENPTTVCTICIFAHLHILHNLHDCIFQMWHLHILQMLHNLKIFKILHNLQICTFAQFAHLQCPTLIELISDSIKKIQSNWQLENQSPAAKISKDMWIFKKSKTMVSPRKSDDITNRNSRKYLWKIRSNTCERKSIARKSKVIEIWP